MIETKEQWEETKDYLWNDADMEPPLVSDYASDVFELIEALRNAARAGKRYWMAQSKENYDELYDTFSTLPAWVLEDE